jgi:hypothetical protein
MVVNGRWDVTNACGEDHRRGFDQTVRRAAPEGIAGSLHRRNLACGDPGAVTDGLFFDSPDEVAAGDAIGEARVVPRQRDRCGPPRPGL